jgi:hypothetical protein
MGETTVTATASRVAGTYNVTVMASGVGSATLTLTNAAGPAAQILVTSGSGQSARVNTVFGKPLVVMVLDADSNPITDAEVDFSAPGTGASASLGTVARTDAQGSTSVTATANGVTGTYLVNARVSGVGAPAMFTLTNTASEGNGFKPGIGVSGGGCATNAGGLPGLLVVLALLALMRGRRRPLER